MLSSSRTRGFLADAIAVSGRSGSPAPESMDQDCAIESMRHSCSSDVPQARPSSSNERRYHSPSHADRSTAAARESDRKRVVEGKSAAVRVDFGGRRIIKNKNYQQLKTEERPVTLIQQNTVIS